jgi:hypothetical protein
MPSAPAILAPRQSGGDGPGETQGGAVANVLASSARREMEYQWQMLMREIAR